MLWGQGKEGVAVKKEWTQQTLLSQALLLSGDSWSPGTHPRSNSESLIAGTFGKSMIRTLFCVPKAEDQEVLGWQSHLTINQGTWFGISTLTGHPAMLSLYNNSGPRDPSELTVFPWVITHLTSVSVVGSWEESHYHQPPMGRGCLEPPRLHFRECSFCYALSRAAINTICEKNFMQRYMSPSSELLNWWMVEGPENNFKLYDYKYENLEEMNP